MKIYRSSSLNCALPITLAGPVSWLIVIILSLYNSSGPDGGWRCMSVMFKGLGVILLIHVISAIILITIVVHNKIVHKPIGKTLIFGLCYYGLIFIIALILSGPQEIIRDSCAIIKALFYK